MTYLIHGATGAQGRPIVSAMMKRGHSVLAATRGNRSLEATNTVAIDLSSASDLERHYRDLDGVFVHLPLAAPDTQMRIAAAIGDALERTSVPRVVVSTSGYSLPDVGEDPGPIGALARRLATIDASVAYVAPRLFFENLLLPPVFEGVLGEATLRYPIREDFAVSWSSHLDVADVVTRLLEDHTITGVVEVGALPAISGNDLAAGFGEYLGRDIRFEAITPQQFGEMITPLFGEAGAAPVVATYEAKLTHTREIIGEDRSAQRLLGLTPRTTAHWLNDIGAPR